MAYLYNNKYFNNILISGLPGILSIFLSFFSIPIFLNFLATELYANFLIQHSILTLGMILNLNIGKFAAIKIQKVNKKLKKEVIFTSIITSFFSGLILSTITYLIIFYFFDDKNFFDISISLLLGLFVTICYISTEHIIKGLSYFKLCSFSNLLFYSLSLSLPAFLLIIDHTNEVVLNNLFNISLLIKFLSLLFLILFLIIKRKLIFTKIDFNLFEDFKIHSKWMTITAIYNQIYDYIDKYLIKINIGALMLVTYSVPQQIAAKLTIFSQSIIAVLLPKLSKQKKDTNKREILSANIYLFFSVISFLLIIFIPFYDEILNWWLKKSYSIMILKLFKIFILLTFIGCVSNIIIAFYEATLSSKINTKYETYSILPFIIGLIICVYLKDIFLFAFLLFLKEFILIFVRMFSIKNYLINFYYFILIVSMFTLTFIVSIFNYEFLSYIIGIIYLTLLVLKLPYHLIFREFFIFKNSKN